MLTKLRISISGSSGTSQYRINNEVVSSQHYERVLKDENILIKARNFLVFQGDVEAIAAQSSKDLSRLIEQISGSLQYKNDYERLKEAQEKSAELSSLTFNKKRNYNAEIRQYKFQANEVEKFNQMIADRDNALSIQALWKLYHLEQSKKTIESELTNLNQEADTRKIEVENLQEESLGVREEYAKANIAVQEKEQQIKQQEKVLADKNKSLLPVDQKILITESNLRKIVARVAKLEEERNHQEAQINNLEEDIRIATAAKEDFERKFLEQTNAAGLRLSDEDNAEYEQLKAQFAEATAERQSEIDNYNRQLKTQEDRVSTLNSKHQQLKIRESNLSAEVAELQSQNVQKEETIADIDTHYNELSQKHAELVEERKKRKTREESLQSKLQEVSDYLSKYNAYTKENERDAKLREVMETMKRANPGIKGFVSDLCRPKQHRYETAVATVLGKDFNSIIVDTFRTAKECIDYMKEQRSGVATFIPLDSVVVHPINSDLRGISEQVRLAVDTVNYDPELEPAVRYVLGSAIICDDLNVAKYVRWKKNVNVKAVTLDGAVIHRAGLMTGGRVENQNSLKWNDAEIARAKKKREQYMHELTELARSRYNNQEEETRADIENLQMRKKVINMELLESQSTHASRESELRHVIQQLRQVERDLSTATSSLQNLMSEFSNIQTDVQEIEDRIFSSFSSRIGVANIREYQDAQQSILNEGSEKRLSLSKHISSLNTQLEFYKSKRIDLQTRIDRANETVGRDNKLIEQLQEERQVLREQIGQVEEEIDAIRVQLSRKARSAENLMTTVNEKSQELVRAQHQYDNVCKRATLLQEDIYKVNMGFIKTLKYCEMEGVDVPLLSGSLEILRLEGEVLGLSDEIEDGLQDSQAISNSAGEVLSQIVIDYSNMNSELKRRGDDQMGEELETNIHVLTSNLEKMVVNTRATERLGDAQQKLREVDHDFERNRADAKKAKDEFEEVKRKRHELFSKAFKHISKQIDKIYKELTKTPTFPLGGTASLSLEDEDEPYLDGVNYHAMPPMKRFCEMELLSGGEKTMAALALLFAIHSYHPSPFFVLDEVDAALDNANVGNIARYIQKHAGPGFQFIVISLKNGLFETSQSLVGIYRDQDENSSRALTMDLQIYEQADRGHREPDLVEAAS